MPRPVVRWSLVVVSGVLATTGLAACGGDDEPSSSGTSTASPSPSRTPSGVSTAKAIARPLKFDQASSVTFPETGVTEAAITATVVLTRADKSIVARKLPDLSSAYTLSAKTGRFTDLWIGPDEKVAVAVEATAMPGTGTQAGKDSFALTEFDLASGKVRNTSTVETTQDSVGAANPTTARVVGSAGGVAVIDTWHASNPGDAFEASTARHTTLGIDLGSQEVAWQARPARPLALSSQRVVVSTGSNASPGQIRALGAREGRVLWSALDGVRQATSAGASSDRVAIFSTSTRSGVGTATSLSLADGSASAGVRAPTWNWSCYPSKRVVKVCSVGGGTRVVGWDVDQNAAAWTLPTRGRVVPAVSAVVDGVVYGLANGAGVALDATNGKDLATGTGSLPSSVSKWGAVSLLESQAVFQRAVAAK